MSVILNKRFAFCYGTVCEIMPLIQVATAEGYGWMKNPAWEAGWKLGDASPENIEKMYRQFMYKPPQIYDNHFIYDSTIPNPPAPKRRLHESLLGKLVRNARAACSRLYGDGGRPGGPK